MFKKMIAWVVTVCLLTAMAPPAVAKSKLEKQAAFAEKVRLGVGQLGVGEDTRVALKLRDKSKVQGYIQEADSTSFTVVDLKTGTATKVAYTNVAQVKGNNLSTGAKIAIGVGVTAGIILLIMAIIWLSIDD